MAYRMNASVAGIGSGHGVLHEADFHPRRSCLLALRAALAMKGFSGKIRPADGTVFVAGTSVCVAVAVLDEWPIHPHGWIGSITDHPRATGTAAAPKPAFRLSVIA